MLDVLFGHSYDAVINKSYLNMSFLIFNLWNFQIFLKTDNVLNKTVFDNYAAKHCRNCK